MDNFSLFFEVHWQDRMGDSFADFRKKYYKLKNDKTLFVNFTNYSNSTIDKTFSQNPDHTDPIGLYAYPIKYVIDHPADIWYGASAKYLRVIKNNAKNILHVQDINAANAYYILNKMGINPSLMDVAQKNFKYPRNSAKIPQQFFAAIQFKLDEKQEGENSLLTRKQFPMRSGKEQSQLLLKAGFDAVLDTGRNEKYGIINPREPEQIVFLRRDAFEIMEIFQLNQKQDMVGMNQPHVAENRDSRKLAAMIFEKLNDKIIDNYDKTYYSKKGKAIEIKFEVPYSYIQNKKIGEKKHKQQKLYSHVDTIINLLSDKKDIHYKADREEKFEEIAEYMKILYNKAETKNDFIPYTKQQYLKSIQDQKDKLIQKHLENKEKEEKERYAYYMPKIIEGMKILGIKFTPRKDFDYVKVLDHAKNINSHKGNKEFWDYYDETFNNIKKLSQEYDYSDLLNDYYMGENREDAKQLRKFYDKIQSKDPYNYWNFALEKLLKDNDTYNNVSEEK